jgi:hypothetical protein
MVSIAPHMYSASSVAKVPQSEQDLRLLQYSAQAKGGGTVRVMGYAGTDSSTRADRVGPYPFRLTNDAISFGMRASRIGDIAPSLRLNAGFAIDSTFSDLDRRGSTTRPPREGDAYAFGQAPAGDLAADTWKVTQISVAPYVELPLSLSSKRIDITPGVYAASLLNNVSCAQAPIGDTPTHGGGAAADRRDGPAPPSPRRGHHRGLPAASAPGSE